MKTICIYHRIDLDGWMSAAIVKHWWLNNYGNDKNRTCSKKVCVQEHYFECASCVFNNYGIDTLDFLGWNYGDPIPDLSEYDKVIMCDISFSKEEMCKLLTQLNGNLIWIDHHISAINDNRELMSMDTLYGLRDVRFAACELTWIYFIEGISYNHFGESYHDYDIPEIVRLLGLYDSFRHKGTEEETKVLEFQYGARQTISNYKEAYSHLRAAINGLGYKLVEGIWDKGKVIYQYLCTEAKQTYKNGFEIELGFRFKQPEPKTVRFENRVPIKFITFNKERFNPINFGIDYHKDGYDGAACFWYQDGQWAFSLYNDNGQVDCSQIAKQYGGGGHKGAAGFKLDSINTFLESFKTTNDE